jgi:hypothetical protein
VRERVVVDRFPGLLLQVGLVGDVRVGEPLQQLVGRELLAGTRVEIDAGEGDTAGPASLPRNRLRS